MPVMSRRLFPLFALPALSLHLLAAQAPAPPSLRIRSEDGTVRAYRALSERGVQLLFPRGEAVFQAQADLPNLGSFLTRAPGRARIVRVGNPARQFVIRGIVYGDGIFSSTSSFVKRTPRS